LLKLRTTKTLNCAFVLYILYTYITLVNCQSTFRFFQYSHSISSELFFKALASDRINFEKKRTARAVLKRDKVLCLTAWII